MEFFFGKRKETVKKEAKVESTVELKTDLRFRMRKFFTSSKDSGKY
jgi:hypothetical protein